MIGSVLNPIRFRSIYTNVPDNLTIFPNNDNTTYGVQNQFGIAASTEFVRHHIGNMYLQFINDLGTVQTFSAYKLQDDGTWDVVTGGFDSVDISPVGWIGYPIHKVTVTGLTDGYYYLLDPDSGLMSDVFRMTSDANVTKDLIKIKYSNSINKFDSIFGTHYYIVYFRGNYLPGESDVEMETYKDDPGIPTKLYASYVPSATISIIAVQMLYKKLIDALFCCDTLEINGVDCNNDKTPSWDKKKEGDVWDVSIEVSEI